VKQSETHRELEEETKKLTTVEETIKEMQQQLAPLRLKAKAMLIPTNNTVITNNKEDTEKNPETLEQSNNNNKSPNNRNRAYLRSMAESEFLKSLFATPNEFTSAGIQSTPNTKAQNSALLLTLSDPPLTGAANCLLEAGKRIFVGCGDGILRIYDRDTARMVLDQKVEPLTGIFSIKLVGREIWTGHRDGRIRIWSAQSFNLRKDFSAHTSTVTGLAYVNNSTVWSVSADMTLRVWDCKTKKCLKKKNTDAYMLCILDYEDKVWVGTESEIVRYNTTTKKKIDSLTQHSKLVHHLIAVVNEQTNTIQIWSCSSDNTICIWDLSGKLVSQINTDHKILQMVECGGDVWCCSWSRMILRISKKTLQITNQYPDAHNDAISSLTVVHDDDGNSRVWSGSWDRTLCIWKSDCKNKHVLNSKQKNALILNWRQLFQGISSASVLSEGVNSEELSSALAAVGRLILNFEREHRDKRSTPVGMGAS